MIDPDNKKVCLIYRDKHNDYTFPKGHLEQGETLLQCAIRETAEESKRVADVLGEYKPFEEEYVNKSGEECTVFMYYALDCGHSENDSTDTHDVVWTAVDEVYNKLTFENQKDMWLQVLPNINEIIKRGRK